MPNGMPGPSQNFPPRSPAHCLLARHRSLSFAIGIFADLMVVSCPLLELAPECQVLSNANLRRLRHFAYRRLRGGTPQHGGTSMSTNGSVRNSGNHQWYELREPHLMIESGEAVLHNHCVQCGRDI